MKKIIEKSLENSITYQEYRNLVSNLLALWIQSGNLQVLDIRLTKDRLECKGYKLLESSGKI